MGMFDYVDSDYPGFEFRNGQTKSIYNRMEKYSICSDGLYKYYYDDATKQPTHLLPDYFDKNIEVLLPDLSRYVFKMKQGKVVDVQKTEQDNTEHIPDTSKLPKISGWLPMDITRKWHDGMQILMAIPIYSHVLVEHGIPILQNEWRYMFDVAVINIDGHKFTLSRQLGGTSEYELEDVDFYIELG